MAALGVMEALGDNMVLGVAMASPWVEIAGHGLGMADPACQGALAIWRWRSLVSFALPPPSGLLLGTADCSWALWPVFVPLPLLGDSACFGAALVAKHFKDHGRKTHSGPWSQNSHNVLHFRRVCVAEEDNRDHGRVLWSDF